MRDGWITSFIKCKWNDKTSMGEKYGLAMEMTTQAEADEWLAASVAHHMQWYGQTEEEARRVQLLNIGYYSGYYDSSQAEMVRALFNTIHPGLAAGIMANEVIE